MDFHNGQKVFVFNVLLASLHFPGATVSLVGMANRRHLARASHSAGQQIISLEMPCVQCLPAMP